MQQNLSRRTKIKLTYDGKDISADLAPYLKAFSYNDVMSGQADDIQITLENRAHLWEADWLPEKGAMLTAAIVQSAWEGQEEQELPLGQFELDEIELSEPPSEVKLKAVSVPNNTALRGVDKNRSWEKTRFSVIAGDIAAGAGLELFYDSEDDPELDHAEQTEQSDLSFLQKLTNDAGLALKITDLKIVIFDEAKYEQAEPVLTIARGSRFLQSYSIRSATREVYAACHVKYQEAKDKETIEATFKAPGKTGKTLEVNEQVKSVGEAEKLARKKLREKNKAEITMRTVLLGAFVLLAGSTVQLQGVGKFDGKYIITRAGHEVGGGYTVSLELRRCLDGY